MVEDVAAGSDVAAEDDDAVEDDTEDDADEDDADEDDDVSPEEAGLGTEYDPDEQDVESEVAELLGEIPAPGFSDGQPAEQVTQVQPKPLPADQSGLFAAPGELSEHDRPTD